MSARIALPTLILTVLAAFPLPGAATAGPWGLAPGEWYANFEGSTFTASTIHLASGDRADTGQIVEQRTLLSYYEIGWKKNATLHFALPTMSVTRRDARVQATATGFQDVLLGLRYNLLNRASAVAIEVDWSAPAGYNRKLDSLGLHLGDGLQELSAELHLGTALFRRGFAQGSIGYGYRYLGIGKRDKGPVVPGDPRTAKYTWADHVLASADLALWVRPSLLLGGRYRGLVTVSSGPLVQETDAHLAGPLLLYRMDDRLDMFVGSWSTASGKNTLHFDQVYVGVAFHRTKLNRLQGFLGGRQAS